MLLEGIGMRDLAEIQAELDRLYARKREIEALYGKYFSADKLNYYCNRFYSRSVGLYSAQHIIQESLQAIAPQGSKLRFHPFIEKLSEWTANNQAEHGKNLEWLTEPFYVYSFYLHVHQILSVLMHYFDQVDDYDEDKLAWLRNWMFYVLYQPRQVYEEISAAAF